ncbi:MAG: ABC transporter permease [Acidobacteria bacterium]|nr:ABC transporter permease [Acidobacteriota bacterium]
MLPLTLVFDSRPDVNVLLATAGFVGVATLLAGIGPALKMSRLDLLADLKEQAAETGARPGWFAARNVLVVAQLSLPLGLLCAGGLFARSAIKASSSDPGFSYQGGVLAAIDPSVAQMSDTRGREIYRAVLERVRSLPGIDSAAVASTVPFGNFHEGRFVERPGVPRDPKVNGPTYRIVSAGYFQALGLQLLKGRDFTRGEEQSATSPRVVIIDTVLARQLFPNEDPVGQTIRFPAGRGPLWQRQRATADHRDFADDAGRADGPGGRRPHLRAVRAQLPGGHEPPRAERQLGSPRRRRHGRNAAAGTPHGRQQAPGARVDDPPALSRPQPRAVGDPNRGAHARSRGHARARSGNRGGLWREVIPGVAPNPRDRHPYGTRRQQRRRHGDGDARVSRPHVPGSCRRSPGGPADGEAAGLDPL